jgi:hypothetical protein
MQSRDEQIYSIGYDAGRWDGEDAAFREHQAKRREQRRRDRVLLAIFVGGFVVLLVASLAYALRVDEPPSSEIVDRLPAGVRLYNVAGDATPEFAKIDGELVPVTIPRQEGWWVPLVPFFGTVVAAVVGAGALIWTNRSSRDLGARVAALENAHRAKSKPTPPAAG